MRESAGEGVSEVEHLAHTGRWHAFQVRNVKKSFLGLFKRNQNSVRIVDEEGVVRLQKSRAEVMTFHKDEIGTDFAEFIDAATTYTDAGAGLPKTYLYFNQKAVDLSGIMNREQLLSLAEMECEFIDEDTEIIAVAAKE